MKKFIEFLESKINESQDWVIDGKYQQSLNQVQQSKWFRTTKVDPRNINLSRGQVDDIFGNEAVNLTKMGIIKRIDSNLNPFGGGTPSYTLVNPLNSKV